MVSCAMISIPTPPRREVVPTKYSSITSLDRPIASKICAPVYDAIVETPIFDITFRTPLPKDLIKFLTAFSGVIPEITPCRTKSSALSIARYGLTAAAPNPINNATW